MRVKRRILFRLSSLILALVSALFTRASVPPSSAKANLPPGPDRFRVATVDYVSYQWLMRAWQGRVASCKITVYHDGLPYKWEVFRDCGEYLTEEHLKPVACSFDSQQGAQCWEGRKSVVCRLAIDHEGQPTPEEVYANCGEEIYDEWIVQPPCTFKDKRKCEGYYLHLISQEKKTKQMPMELPQATAWISLEDCQPVLSASTNICESQPTLVITGEEPLPNETIVRVAGTYDDAEFSCDKTNVCKFHIKETDDEGVPVAFWAYSSYGDSSVIYTARVRVQQADEGDPDQPYWYVDVLSSQWRGEVSATCADTWGVFPPVGGVPEWLTTPNDASELSSDIPYTYLAANLILQGAVDARGCPDGGIAPGGAANQCGLEAARDSVAEWQNQFDSLIVSVARETSVPARLLKNLFARESQFWPGIYQSAGDVGLGQLTENGADTALYWNKSFYQQFCPLVLPANLCKKGYMRLSEENQIRLRRALVSSVNATCADCPLGLDLSQANFSVSVFAHTMIANCGQAAQVIYNYTGQPVNEIAEYEDLWRFTLTNYNAGGGCLAEAVSNAYARGEEITWENVSRYLTGACSGAVDYVNDVSRTAPSANQ